MSRWPLHALRVCLWGLGGLASGWLCHATWRIAPPADAPTLPPPLPRPITPEEIKIIADLEAELAQHIEAWREIHGRAPALEELGAALPQGLLPDNPALPDVGGLEASCAASPAAAVDWLYCASTGRLRAGLPAVSQ